MAAVNGKAGETRSALRASYLLHTPDAFVRAPLPEITNGFAIVHCSPELGARFLLYTAELQPQGTLAPTVDQRFVWVVEGKIAAEIDGARPALEAGSYAYLSAGSQGSISALSSSRLLVLEKSYQPLKGIHSPPSFFAREHDAAACPLDGNPGLMVQCLLPTGTAFDFAVNVMAYAPGASLAQVEIHVMEHGLLMLEGAGTYRLADDLHHVEAGDVIWMAPFCPQWFVADANTPAKYLIYKDWNRRPRL